MEVDYYVQNKKTQEVLNRQGTWSEYFGSYRLATFTTHMEAEAAFPSGVECIVVSKKKREAKVYAEGTRFALMHRNAYYSSNDTFTSPASSGPQTVLFTSKDAALDKAEELGLHLDRIQVVTVPNQR
jgi:hypothetical protein